ncbi:hypothetical protein D3C75_1280010 [compost metagenome]
MPLDITEPEKVGNLPAEDRHSDSCREADGHRLRNELDQNPQPEQSHQHKNHPGHHPGNQQILIAVLHCNGEQDRDKCAGWPADLKF